MATGDPLPQPDVTGRYERCGEFGGESAYQLDGQDWFIWWDNQALTGGTQWVLSAALGGAVEPTDAWWVGSGFEFEFPVATDYIAEGTATGIVIISEIQ